MEQSQESTQLNLSNNQNKHDNSKKMRIMTHHKYFTDSFIEIINIVLKKSNEVNFDDVLNDKSKLKLYNGHIKLRTVCNDLINGFSNDDQYDQGRIIKKIYKVITMYIDKFFPIPSKELFTLKNNDGAIITIIPGLDINLVTSIMNNEEMENLWDYMYVMYISSVSIISLINEHKKGKVYEILPQMRERVIKSGVLHRGSKFGNPFFGVNGLSSDSDSLPDQYNIDSMFSNVDQIEIPKGDLMENLFQMSGVEKLIDINQLNEQLKNVKQEDTQEATKSITKLLGAENDKDVAEVVSTLVEGIVEDLKANSDKGMQGMYETAKTVSKKVGSQIDSNKMGKTIEKLSAFMKDGQSNLKNLKDDKGNPIGEQLMNSLKGPLEMAQKMGNGKNGSVPDFSNMASLFSQVSEIAKSNNLNNNTSVNPKQKKINKSDPVNAFSE